MSEPSVESRKVELQNLKRRLEAEPPPRKPRKKSVSADIRALLPEIRMKRAAGWTWEQIAETLYDDPAKSSAVRTAFNRTASRKSKKTKTTVAASPEVRSTTTSPPSPPAQAVAPSTAKTGAFDGLFGQLNDPGFDRSAMGTSHG